jgi:hypothetical protein
VYATTGNGAADLASTPRVWGEDQYPHATTSSSSAASRVFVSGSTRAAENSIVSVPPGVARLRIVTGSGQPAYLAVDATAKQVAFLSPGSPVVTSNVDSSGGLVWVLDANLPRAGPLVGPDVPHPVLYALDADSMQVVGRSAPDQLDIGGKYNTPAMAHGVVYVGTDRIQAFGLATN